MKVMQYVGPYGARSVPLGDSDLVLKQGVPQTVHDSVAEAVELMNFGDVLISEVDEEGAKPVVDAVAIQPPTEEAFEQMSKPELVALFEDPGMAMALADVDMDQNKPELVVAMRKALYGKDA